MHFVTLVFDTQNYLIKVVSFSGGKCGGENREIIAFFFINRVKANPRPPTHLPIFCPQSIYIYIITSNCATWHFLVVKNVCIFNFHVGKFLFFWYLYCDIGVISCLLNSFMQSQFKYFGESINRFPIYLPKRKESKIMLKTDPLTHKWLRACLVLI